MKKPLLRPRNLLTLAAIGLSLVKVANAQIPPDLTRPYWNDPEFVRDFMGTYAVMSGSEPKIEATEAEFFKRLSAQLKVGADAGLALINKEIKPNSSAAIYFIRGNLNFQKGKLEDARRDYETSLSKFKNFLRAHKNLGMIHLRKNNFSKAGEELGRAIELGDREANTYGLLAYCLLQTNRYLEAENAYRNALMLTPGNKDWSLGLAQSLMQIGDSDGAIRIMEPIALSSSNEPQFWLFLVNAYLQKDESDAAAEILEFMRNANLTDLGSLTLLANIYTNQQDYTLALDVFKEVLNQDGDKVDPSVVLDASNLFVRYGAFDEAATLLQQIANEFGDALESEQKLTLLRLNAQVANAAGELEKSVAIHENILEIDPTDGLAMIELARYYANQQDFPRAYLYLDRAERLTEHQVRALRLRGQLLVREGRLKEAIDPLERAVSLSDNNNINRQLEDYIEQVKRAAGVI